MVIFGQIEIQADRWVIANTVAAVGESKSL